MKKINFLLLIIIFNITAKTFCDLEKEIKSIEVSSLEGDFKCALMKLTELIHTHKDFNSYTARIKKILKSIEASTLSEADKVKAKELFSEVIKG